MSAHASEMAATGPTVPEGRPALPPRISWGAVFAGGVVAVAIGAMLNLLGIAVGATTMDPGTPGGTPSASTFGIASGIWLFIATLIGLGVGGYVAARLSGTSDHMDGLLHGLAVWAIGYLLSMILLGNVIAGTASTASNMVSGLGSAVGGLAQGAGQAVTSVADSAGVNTDQVIGQVQAVLRGGQAADPQSLTSEQRNAAIADLLRQRVTQGELQPAQREQLANLVAAEYGIEPAEAQQRLDQANTQINQTVQQARQTAEQAATAAADATAVAAYWAFAAMLLGAVAAVLGARIGTRRAVALAERRYA